MYKLIIADDEGFIRSGLKQGVDWNSLGFEVVADFDDGKPLIEYITKYDADVILTDIRMCLVSGLDVAKFVSENKPNIKVILLSGYQEFEMARKSIEYGVENYLLKPININEIKDIFTNLKNNLDKVKSQNESHLELLNFTKTTWLQDLYFGVITSTEEIQKQMQILYGITDFGCFVLDFQIDNYEELLTTSWKYGKDALTTGIINIMQIRNTFEAYNISSHNGREIYIGVIKENFSHELFESYTEQIKINLMELINIQITLHEATYFSNAVLLANNRFNLVFSDSDTSLLNKTDEYKKLIITNLTTLNLETAQKLSQNFIDKLSHCPLWLCQSFCIEILSSIRHIYTELNINSQIDTLGYINEIMHSKNQHDLVNTITSAISCLSKFAPRSSLNQEESIIQKAKGYIELNYNKDISLDSLADVLYINKSYLCRLFKEKSGSNFTDYLISVRLQKAIELINNNTSLQFVGEMVGYSDLRYFSRLFKNKMGLTPTEYKKTLN